MRTIITLAGLTTLAALPAAVSAQRPANSETARGETKPTPLR